MSVKLMAEIFESEVLGPTERLVLLALADHAGEEGTCYPSISRLCQRTGLKERAVQSNIQKLKNAGYISIEMNAGKRGSNLYTIRSTPAADAPLDPRSRCTPQEMHPAADAPHPRSKCTPTPAADAPEPSVTISEPSGNSAAREIRSILCQWASGPAVDSFIAYRRKQKGKALSVTAAHRQAKQLETIFQRGGDTDDALGMAEERGWQSVQADWYFNAKGKSHGNRNHDAIGAPDGPGNRPDPVLANIARLAGIGETPGDDLP